MIPKKVKVNHRIFKIFGVPQDGFDKDDGDTDHYLGLTDLINKTIYIDNDIPDEQVKCTLLHEIIHAIDFASGFTLQESEVKMLGYGIYGVMKDNPKVREFIFGG